MANSTILRVIFVLSAIATSQFVPSVQAQGKKLQQKRPANIEDINLYRNMALHAFCQARDLGINFDKAITISASTYVFVLKQRHEGIVRSVGVKPIDDGILWRSVETQILGKALQACPDGVPNAEKMRFEYLKKRAINNGMSQ